MSLFNLNKKKEETKCNCECECSSNENEVKNECCCKEESKSIKVLGSGCRSCHELYENVKEAVKTMGLSIEVEYITDMAKVMEYGVMSMPAMVVNEQVVSMGKVLKEKDVEKLLHKLGY